MKLHIRIRRMSDEHEEVTPHYHMGIQIPKGSGLERATVQIDEMLKSTREIALELYKADAEGRPPNIELIQ